MKIIAGILSVFLFWGSLMPKNDFSELAKFSHLIEHYEEHNQKAAHQLSFFDFLEMHYGAQKGKHTDEHEGNDCLPLQHLVANGGVVFVFSDDITFAHTQLQPKATLVSFYLPPTSVAQLAPMWHPPKA